MDTPLDEALARKFKRAFGEKSSAIEDHVDIVKQILKDAMLSGALRAIPITTRMKKLESAVGSLERRQAARMEREDLKQRMTNAGVSWETYWKNLGKEDMIDDCGPFKDLDSMMNALHDFGGVRVCVYFPQDVEKVVSWLTGCGQVEIKRVIRKTQSNPTMSNLRRDVAIMEQKSSIADQGNRKKEPQAEPHDTGYRATHVIVELKGDAIPKYHKESHYKIEIQIGTVVMHAWSQIEHDIIYKPDVTEPSDAQRDILEVFNGIVRSGEAALKQLAKTNDQKERDRAQNENTPADSHFEIGVWIADYCKKHKLRLDKEGESPTWGRLSKLLDILRSSDEEDESDDDTSGGLKKLLEYVRLNFLESSPDAFDEDLPLYLLKAKYELEHKHTQQFSSVTVKDRTQVQAEEARHLAFQVIHSINMASYLGFANDFILGNNVVASNLEDLSSRPSLVDFLDVLHPQKPRIDTEAESRLIKFCINFLDNKKPRDTIKDEKKLLRAEIPLLLTHIARVVHPVGKFFVPDDDSILSDKDVLSIVPYSLARILRDEDYASWIPFIFKAAELASGDAQVPGQTTRVDWRKTGEELFSHDLRGSAQETDIFLNGASAQDTSDSQDELNHHQLRDGTKIPSRPILLADMKSARHSNHSSPQLRKLEQGYFVPSNTRSSWRYVHQEPLRWTVHKIDLTSPLPHRPFQKFTRANLWVDFANRIKPSYMADVVYSDEGDPEKYRFWVGNCEFTFDVLDSTLECKLREDGTSKFAERDTGTPLEGMENGSAAKKSVEKRQTNPRKRGGSSKPTRKNTKRKKT